MSWGRRRKRIYANIQMFEKKYSLKLGEIAVVPLAGTWIEIFFVIVVISFPYLSFPSREEELKRVEEFRKAQAEIEKKNDAKAVSQKMFKVV